jgi:hypothetical protein
MPNQLLDLDLVAGLADSNLLGLNKTRQPPVRDHDLADRVALPKVSRLS